ncbi:MAG: mannosylglycerate hydrolase [Actinomycetota bacterium]|nr:mannosylglycerate hydrolase [Actinomycetota bacterium]
MALIAKDLHSPLPGALQQHFQRTEAALEELLWDEPSGQYYSRDAFTKELIKVPTVATLLPLWSGTPSPARAERLTELMQQPNGFWPTYPVPSVPIDAPEFRAAGYWKGPTWVNMNWMIYEGLRNYHRTDRAQELRDRTLDLVARAGFSEYFSPLTGQGYGADDFSWTAALVIDLLQDESLRPTRMPE